ncbi:spinocerebellar ataxia type 10 protein domain-containing protein [Cerioporus squamosus]|nr:spinocerebellar ataxia type 10 protein domain-containing protein [Cerioporus squamosus]
MSEHGLKNKEGAPGTNAEVLSIQNAASSFDPELPGQVRELVRVLDQASTLLAADEQARENIGNATSPSIWPVLAHLWSQTLHGHMLPDPEPEQAAQLSVLCASLAKFTRNLAAATPRNQEQAFQNELSMRRLLYHYTSYSATQDPASYPATRMLSQALSNFVTNNSALADILWSTYLSLPEEQLILTRLFASPDARTVSSTFVLVLNCLHDSDHRIELLVEAPRGPRICLSILDRMASLFEADEASEHGRAFDIGYGILCRVIEAGLVTKLYRKLAVEDEPITPHQTTLLKVLDSYLHSEKHPDQVAVSLLRQPGARPKHLLDMLTETWMSLATYAQGALKRALGSQVTLPADESGAATASKEGESSPLSDGGTETMSMHTPRVSDQGNQDSGTTTSQLQELDLLLPKVCEALVLVTQCLTTIALRAEEAGSSRPTSDGGTASPSPRTFMVAASTSTGQGFVESLVETLRLIDLFVPRITYGKVVQRPPAPGHPNFQGRVSPNANISDPDRTDGGADGSADAQRPTWTGATEAQPGAALATESQTQKAKAAAEAFAHVKRDLVRLLGILASHDRAVQDRVRECSGIPVVMNLCVVDDYNPYLREHAIFALRNILDGNLENQAVVNAIQPVGRWDENKVLQEFRSSGRAGE